LAKTLVIITGPQGSGNHLFSKIFAASTDVFGWQDLNDTYWVAHDQEPFAKAWHDPTQLKHIVFDRYAVTSISCPYAYHGTTTEPNYEKFITAAKDLGYHVRVAVIGRDQNVIQYQQTRVRGVHSYPRFGHRLPDLCHHEPVFISTELLYLYRMHYVRSLPALLGIPVDITEQQLEEILIQDPNAKYFQPAEEQPLDSYVRTVSGLNNVSAE
jgi:predicted ABC-type ATPase